MWNDRQLASMALVGVAVLIAARENCSSVPVQGKPQVEQSTHANPESVQVQSNPSAPVISEIALAAAEATMSRVEEVRLNKKQTLGQMLLTMGVSTADVDRALKVLNPVCALRRVSSQQKIKMTFGANNQLQKLSFYMQRDHVMMQRGEDGLLHATKETIPVQVVRLEGTINTSLYKSLKALNVSGRITNEAIQAMAAATDVSHIRPGDKFVMLVETYHDDTGRKLPLGGVCALAMQRGKKWNVAYRYDSKGQTRFLNASGQGASSGRLVMPVSIKCMRISGRFGARLHPIRGYTCQHKGVDLAAPTGTAVMSAADGVIVKACYYGAYGKYVLVKHSGGYSTAYAHLSQISVKVGDRVKQHQTIGKVGATGMATGPHLHYEVHKNNNHINPLAAVSLPAASLNHQEMLSFKAKRMQLDGLLKI